MVLLLDNYDSFTYNLYDYIKQLGKECLVIRNDEKTIDEIAALDIESIIISPGPGVPSNAGITMDLIQYYYNKKPILGICLGHQALAEFFNADLVKSIKPVHGKTSTLFFEKHELFSEIYKPFEVMRYHSLIIENLKLPLKSVAKTKEGELMAFCHNDLPLVGIQFHPESILTENGLTLMKNFFEKIAIN